jgi:hypothetical protein
MRDIISLLPVLLVCGCGQSQGDGAPSAANQQAESVAVRPALLSPSNATNAAGFEGYFEVEGPCIYITNQRGSQSRTLPAFTIPGLQWDAGQQALISRGKVFRMGERVLLAGGQPFKGQPLTWIQPPDESCDASNVMIVGDISLPPEGAPTRT